MLQRNVCTVCDTTIVRVVPVNLVKYFMRLKKEKRYTEGCAPISIAMMYKILVEDWERTKKERNYTREELENAGGVCYIKDSLQDFYPLGFGTIHRSFRALQQLGLIKIQRYRHWVNKKFEYSFGIIVYENTEAFEHAHSPEVRVYRSDLAAKIREEATKHNVRIDEMNATFVLTHLVYLASQVDSKGNIYFKDIVMRYEDFHNQIPWITAWCIGNYLRFFRSLGCFNTVAKIIGAYKKLFTFKINKFDTMIILALLGAKRDHQIDIDEILEKLGADLDHIVKQYRPIPYVDAIEKAKEEGKKALEEAKKKNIKDRNFWNRFWARIRKKLRSIVSGYKKLPWLLFCEFYTVETAYQYVRSLIINKGERKKRIAKLANEMHNLKKAIRKNLREELEIVTLEDGKEYFYNSSTEQYELLANLVEAEYKRYHKEIYVDEPFTEQWDNSYVGDYEDEEDDSGYIVEW